MSNGSERKPQEKSENREVMHGRNQESIHNEKAVQEVKRKHGLLENKYT